jgi:hypothetical protein
MGEKKLDLMIFFGECDFNFTYHYYNKHEHDLMNDREILATELCDKERIRNEYGGQYIEKLGQKENIHLFFGVDINNFNLFDSRWNGIVNERTPVEIRFNFPWYKVIPGNVEVLVNDLFNSAYALLDPGGKLIVGFHEHEQSSYRYGIDNFENPMEGKFKYLEKRNIHEEYPDYILRSSIPDQRIQFDKDGYEYHYEKLG